MNLTPQMISLVNDLKSQDAGVLKEMLSSLTKRVLQSEDEELISSLLVVSYACLENIGRYLPSYIRDANSLHLSSIASEFLLRAVQGNVTSDPFQYLWTLSKNLTMRNYLLSDVSGDQIDLREFSVDDQRILNEVVVEELYGLPVELRIGVLHSIANRTNSEAFSTFDRFVISQVKSKIIAQMEQRDLSVKILPDTQTGKILMLNSIRKNNPFLLVLLSLVKDPVKVFQISKLFGGQTVKVPTQEELLDMFVISNSLVNELESKRSTSQLSTRDSNLLLNLSNELECDEEFELSEYLQEFLTKSINVSTKAYGDLIEKISTDALKSGVSADKCKAIVIMLNKELGSQFRLLGDLQRSIRGIEDVSTAKNNLQEEISEKVKEL